MPAIFSTSDRDELRRHMMDAGWRCLLERGYRGTRIEDVAREARIGQGTFYGFFTSKAQFVAEMVAQNRRELFARLERARADAGGELGRDALGEWMREVWHSERTVFRCIDVRDYRRIRDLLPDDVVLGPELGRASLSELVGPAPDGVRRDLGLAAALQRSLAVVLLSRDEFEPGVLERVVDALVDDTLDALYGPGDAKGDDAR